MQGYCSHFQDRSSFFSNSWLYFYFYKNCSFAQRDGEAESFQATLTHDSQHLVQLTPVCLTLGSNSWLWLSNCSCQFCPRLFFFLCKTPVIFIIWSIISELWSRCNEIGFEINIYIFIFDFDMWFSTCIFCIFHLYKKVFGVACSSFLKLTPIIRNLLISGSSNSDSLYIGLLEKQKTVGKIIMAYLT